MPAGHWGDKQACSIKGPEAAGNPRKGGIKNDFLLHTINREINSRWVKGLNVTRKTNCHQETIENPTFMAQQGIGFRQRALPPRIHSLASAASSTSHKCPESYPIRPSPGAPWATIAQGCPAGWC